MNKIDNKGNSSYSNDELEQEVYVDQDECTSCNQCADNLPEVFAMGDEGLAYVINSKGADKDSIKDEMDSCPGECIHWKNSQE